MRISDWSSDVCSSDLKAIGMMKVGLARRMHERPIAFGAVELLDHRGQRELRADVGKDTGLDAQGIALLAALGDHFPRCELVRTQQRTIIVELVTGPAAVGAVIEFGIIGRSEEHTSELQSLMRISYAVFCLK